MENEIVNLVIDGQKVSAPAGSTILAAAQAAGIEIPNLCFMKELKPYGACGLCVVEVEKCPKLLRACATKVAEGMVVNTKGERAMKALNEFLRPEFINRVDEVVCFNQLTEENFRGIAALMLDELRDVMREKGVELSWDESLIDYLVKEAYSVTYGARNLRRTIQKKVEDEIARYIIANRGREVHRIHLSADEGREKVILTET